MNLLNSKTYDPHGLLRNISNKINLKSSEKFVVLSNLAYTIHGKVIQNNK